MHLTVTKLWADDFDSTRLLEGRLFRMICQTLVKIPHDEQLIQKQNELRVPDTDVISRTVSVASSKPTKSTRQHVTSIEPDFDIRSVIKSTARTASTDVIQGIYNDFHSTCGLQLQKYNIFFIYLCSEAI